MATPMPFVIAGAQGAIFWAPLLGLLAGIPYGPALCIGGLLALLG